MAWHAPTSIHQSSICLHLHFLCVICYVWWIAPRPCRIEPTILSKLLMAVGVSAEETGAVVATAWGVAVVVGGSRPENPRNTRDRQGFCCGLLRLGPSCQSLWALHRSQPRYHHVVTTLCARVYRHKARPHWRHRLCCADAEEDKYCQIAGIAGYPVLAFMAQGGVGMCPCATNTVRGMNCEQVFA